MNSLHTVCHIFFLYFSGFMQFLYTEEMEVILAHSMDSSDVEGRRAFLRDKFIENRNVNLKFKAIKTNSIFSRSNPLSLNRLCRRGWNE